MNEIRVEKHIHLNWEGKGHEMNLHEMFLLSLSETLWCLYASLYLPLVSLHLSTPLDSGHHKYSLTVMGRPTITYLLLLTYTYLLTLTYRMFN